MQKFISKYGLATHLAVITAAPLLLVPFFEPGTIAVALLWLSAFGALWTLLSPSQLQGEMLHESRLRSEKNTVLDPLFWFLAALVLFAGLRWMNCGVGLRYDAETFKWSLGGGLIDLVPTGVRGSGALPFAVSVALLVVLTACRHALGKAARMAFLYALSVLGGVAGLVSSLMVVQHSEKVWYLATCPQESPSHLGTAFGVLTLVGFVSFFGILERKTWMKVVPLGVLSIGGTTLGAIFFSPPLTLGAFAIALVPMTVLSFASALKGSSSSSFLKGIVVFIVGLLVPSLIVIGFAPDGLLDDRLSVFVTGKLFPDGFSDMRNVLTGIAHKSWDGCRWLGSGLGTFNYQIRFNAVESDWDVISPLQTDVPSAWWMLLAERGIVGALIFAVMLGFLLWTYFRRFVASIGRHSYPPSCWLAPAATLAAVATGFFDTSVLRPEMTLIVPAVFAISASSMPLPRKQETGTTQTK